MLKINLLPLEKRKKEDFFPFSFLLRIAICFFLLLSLFTLSLLGLTGHTRRCIRRIESDKKWTEFFRLKEEEARLVKQKAELERYLNRDFSWTEKFVILDQTLPSGIWLNRLSWERQGEKKVFLLKGETLSTEEGVQNVIQFVNNLKKQKDFFKDFKEIKLLTRQESEGRTNFELLIPER